MIEHNTANSEVIVLDRFYGHLFPQFPLLGPGVKLIHLKLMAKMIPGRFAEQFKIAQVLRAMELTEKQTKSYIKRVFPKREQNLDLPDLDPHTS